MGVLTLEDVIEKMLRVDIVDESDREEAISKMQEGKKEGNLAQFLQMRYIQNKDKVEDSTIDKL